MESYAGGGDDHFSRPRRPAARHQPGAARPDLRHDHKAAGEVGIPHNPDYNGASQEGIAMSQATIAPAAE